MEKLPVDLEQMVRLPPSPDGKGYPHRISARDLMANYVFASVDVPDMVPEPDFDVPNGIKMLKVTGQGGHQQRQIYTDPLPDDPANGDMMYFYNGRWITLPNPGAGFFVLTHDGTVPAWSETSECS
jgi:hypothetical protein